MDLSHRQVEQAYLPIPISPANTIVLVIDGNDRNESAVECVQGPFANPNHTFGSRNEGSNLFIIS